MIPAPARCSRAISHGQGFQVLTARDGLDCLAKLQLGEAVHRIVDTTIAKIEAFAGGNPQNAVNESVVTG